MKKGMNPEAVERLGQQVQEAGDTVMQLFQQISSRVEGFDWTGEDRDRYVGEFADTLGQAAQQVAQSCGHFSERASQNAAKQREASS